MSWDDPDSAVARMVSAARLHELVPTARDASLTDDEWWAMCEPYWRGDPDYLANLEAKARQHGRRWVREHMAGIHAYWKNALQVIHVAAFIDERGSLDDF